MAEAICAGVKAAGKECSLFDAKDYESVDGACALVIGSSTRMKRPLPKVRQILSNLGNLNGMPVAAFGSYGWSGEAPDEISNLLIDTGGESVIAKPIKAKDYPSEDSLEQCRDLGRSLADNCD
jgi:flavorubredoxin